MHQILSTLVPRAALALSRAILFISQLRDVGASKRVSDDSIQTTEIARLPQNQIALAPLIWEIFRHVLI